MFVDEGDNGDENDDNDEGKQGKHKGKVTASAGVRVVDVMWRSMRSING